MNDFINQLEMIHSLFSIRETHQRQPPGGKRLGETIETKWESGS